MGRRALGVHAPGEFRGSSKIDFVKKGEELVLELNLEMRENRMYLPVSLFGGLYYGLLDSGASVSVIGSKGWNKLKRLGIPVLPSVYAAVRVANGKRCDILGQVEIPLEIEGQSRLCTFTVVPDLVQEVILGLDLWRLFGIVPNVLAGTCKLLNLKEFEVADLVVSEEDLVEMPISVLEHIMNCNRPVSLRPRSFVCQGANGGYSEGFVCSVEPALDKSVLAVRELAPTQAEALEALVDRFKPTLGRDQLGRTHLFKIDINTGDAQPTRQRFYPYSPKMLEIMHKGLDEWLQQGVVEPSRSPWASPVLLIKKKDGDYRWVVDLRRVNAVTKADAYPLPRIHDILDQLRDARFMSSIDLKSAYFQIPLGEDSKEKTAFIVPNRGLFQFTRMPQGLKTSAATWQRFIDEVLGEDLKPFVFVYLDDIICISRDFEHHLKLLESIMSRLELAGLTINFEKCRFCRKELKYLGYIVNEFGLQVDPEKVRAIAEFRRPKDAKGVKRFVGMASWYRRFIVHFATIMAPLNRLTSKSVQFRWTDDCERGFLKVKEDLMSAPILTCPDFSKPFDLHCDASGFGLGAVLSQDDRPIAYASRSLSKTERKYSATELECLAVVWAIEHFRGYLEGYSFRVITDHASLLWLHNLKEPCGRLGRWSVRLQQYDFTIIHRKGKEHEAPDALSREPLQVEFEDEEPCVDLVLVEGKSEDDWYEKLKGEVVKDAESYPSWKVEEGQLLKLIAGADGAPSWAIVVPRELRAAVLIECHDAPTAGHGGVNKTVDRVRRRYYWPRMRADVKQHIGKCGVCLETKVPSVRPAGLFGKSITIDRPMQVLATDLQGPFPRSKEGYKYLSVTVCLFSKYVWIKPLRSIKSVDICKHLEQDVFLKHGPPASILCDNGTQYACAAFQTLCKSYGVEVRYNFPYHQQANPAERYNRVVKTMMVGYMKGPNHKDWDQQLPFIVSAMNTSVHEVTKFSPYRLMFGEEWVESGKLKGVLFRGSELPDFADRSKAAGDSQKREKIRKVVVDRLRVAYEKNKGQYNLRRRPVSFVPGQQVYRRNFVQSDKAKDFAEKLAPKYIGPFTVVKKVGYRGYMLKDAEGARDGPWHVEHLKGLADVAWVEGLSAEFPRVPLKVCSWNVAGFRAGIRKGAGDFLVRQDFDIICLQETKCSQKDIVAWAEKAGYFASAVSSSNVGYAGVAILSKFEPIRVSVDQFGESSEGRVLIADFGRFVVVTVYAPYSGLTCQNLEKKLFWQKELIERLAAYSGRAVILAGDFNVASSPLDVAHCEAGPQVAGSTRQEREAFWDLLGTGFQDSFRVLNPERRRYSFWSYSRKCRERNAGWRLDYILLSEQLACGLTNSVIFDRVRLSDHSPVATYLVV